MLTVDVKFIAYELTPGLESGKYDIADGSTVRDVISLCENQCGASVPPDKLKRLYPLFNGQPVTLDTPITKDGTLHVCRVVMGG